MDDGETLRVLVVAGDSLARAGLATLLADQPGYTIVGQSAPDSDLSSALETYRPDVVVWDAGWDPEMPGDDLAGLAEAQTPVLVLLPAEADAADTYAAGARGLLSRDTDALGIAAALRAIARGLIVWDPVFGSGLSSARDRAPVTLGEALTPREAEVLQWLAEGLSNKAIAERLAISEHTAKFHVNAILGKLGAHSRTEAVTRAVRFGLVAL